MTEDIRVAYHQTPDGVELDFQGSQVSFRPVDVELYMCMTEPGWDIDIVNRAGEMGLALDSIGGDADDILYLTLLFPVSMRSNSMEILEFFNRHYRGVLLTAEQNAELMTVSFKAAAADTIAQVQEDLGETINSFVRFFDKKLGREPQRTTQSCVQRMNLGETRRD